MDYQLKGIKARQAALRNRPGYRPPKQKAPKPPRQQIHYTPGHFAGDPSPAVLKEAFAAGTNKLKSMGFQPTRTMGMLMGLPQYKKQYTILEIFEAIGTNKLASVNFWRFVAAGCVEMSAEQTMMTHPRYFSKKAIAVAKKRLAEIGTPAGEASTEFARNEIARKRKGDRTRPKDVS